MQDTKVTAPTDRPRRRAPLGLALVLTLTCALGAACSDDSGSSTASTTTGAGTASSDDGSSGDSAPSEGGAGSDTTGPDGTAAAGEPSTSAPPTTAPLPELTDVEQSYVDAVLTRPGQEEEILPGVDNECVVTNWIDVIGGDELEANGVTPEAFAEGGPAAAGIDRETGAEMFDSLDNCGAGLDAFYGIWASAYGIDPAAVADAMECMRTAVPPDEFEDTLIDMFMGADEDGTDLDDAFTPCVLQSR